MERLQQMPRIGHRNAKIILAEIGLNIDQFPSAAHFVSWSGLSPGNNESVGKLKRGA